MTHLPSDKNKSRNLISPFRRVLESKQGVTNRAIERGKLKCGTCFYEVNSAPYLAVSGEKQPIIFGLMSEAVYATLHILLHNHLLLIYKL